MVNITFNKVTVMIYKYFAFFLLKDLAIKMLQTDKPIVKIVNIINLRSLALNGIFNMFVCVEGTHQHPKISTRIRLSKTI